MQVKSQKVDRSCFPESIEMLETEILLCSLEYIVGFYSPSSIFILTPHFTH